MCARLWARPDALTVFSAQLVICKQCVTGMLTVAIQQSECENLSRVVRELAESRAQLVACRAVQSERIEELQAECMRIMRIADLSRTVSKENITKATQAKKHARQVRQLRFLLIALPSCLAHCPCEKVHAVAFSSIAPAPMKWALHATLPVVGTAILCGPLLLQGRALSHQQYTAARFIFPAASRWLDVCF